MSLETILWVGSIELEDTALPPMPAAPAAVATKPVTQLAYKAAKSTKFSEIPCQLLTRRGPASDGYQMYFTSGTTGLPKGVVLSHEIVVKHALGTIQGMYLGHSGPCLTSLLQHMIIAALGA